MYGNLSIRTLEWICVNSRKNMDLNTWFHLLYFTNNSTTLKSFEILDAIWSLFFFPGCVYEYPIHIIISCISAHERGQPTASYNCTDWVWGTTGWNPRHQGNYCSFQRNWRNIPPSNKRNTKRFQHVTRLDLETQARISTEYAQKPPPKHWCQLPNGRVHHNVMKAEPTLLHKVRATFARKEAFKCAAVYIQQPKDRY